MRRRAAFQESITQSAHFLTPALYLTSWLYPILKPLKSSEFGEQFPIMPPGHEISHNQLSSALRIIFAIWFPVEALQFLMML